MARSSFLLASSLTFFSLLIAASADYHGYVPRPKKVNYDKPINSEMFKNAPLPIGVEATVLCKSGSKYTPLHGAKIRVTCLAMDENGYEGAPFSVLSCPSDKNGYVFATLYPSQIGDHLTVTKCKAFLYESGSDNCNVPTNINRGITGYKLEKYRFLQEKKMKLFSAGTFFYTTGGKYTPFNHGY